jgi:hypothetical protein
MQYYRYINLLPSHLLFIYKVTLNILVEAQTPEYIDGCGTYVSLDLSFT